MRGSDKRSGELFSYLNLEERVRGDHPLRAIRSLSDCALETLWADFAALYSGTGRPSIPREKLLRAMLLQAFYSIRSERQLMERLEFDHLFKWFVRVGVNDGVWNHSTFSKNRDRLLEGEIAAKFLAAVLGQLRVKRLLSSDHFSVDGTLIEAWDSMKSFNPKDPPEEEVQTEGGRNAPADFKGEKRSNETHHSTTDPDAMLYRKRPGMEAKLCFIGHGLMENRSGLLVDARLTRYRCPLSARRRQVIGPKGDSHENCAAHGGRCWLRTRSFHEACGKRLRRHRRGRDLHAGADPEAAGRSA
jgi:transposase